MALFTIREILDLVIMSGALGYIFMSYIPRIQSSRFSAGFNWEDFKFALYITVPAIAFHELMHKFVALFLGIKEAVFHASYFGLFLGVFLKLIHSPFMIFIPGYVSIAGAEPLQGALTAFAGPAANLLLFFGAKFILERKKTLTRQQALGLYLTKQINLFLFIFNMLPIPPFDGSQVFAGLYHTLF